MTGFTSVTRILFHDVIETATHHFPTTSHASFDPCKGFLIPQTFLSRISTFLTGGEAIVANDAATAAGVAAFGHDSCKFRGLTTGIYVRKYVDERTGLSRYLATLDNQA